MILRIITSALMLSVAADSLASTISLRFDSLPSSQGWEYNNIDGGRAESDAFQVAGNVLRQSASEGSAGASYYTYPLTLDLSQGYIVDIRAKVVDFDANPPSIHRGGFNFQMADGSNLLNLSLSDTHLDWYYVGASGTVLSVNNDNTVFHDYRFEVSGNGHANFYIDNLLIGGQDISNAGTGNNKTIYLGDLYFGEATSAAEIQRFEVRVVPLPGGLVLFASGLLGLFVSRRRGRVQ